MLPRLNNGEDTMAQSTQPISLLRQRMIEDMQLRKLTPITQTSYIRAVKNSPTISVTRRIGRARKIYAGSSCT